MYADDHEELSRQSLVGQSIAINGRGRAYLRASHSAERAVAARKRFVETHGDVGQVSLVKAVEYGTFMFGLACIYVVDVLLFGASAEYVASLIGSESEIWSTLAKYVVPACFLGIEILIALEIESANHDVRFAFGSRAVRKGWIALGVLVALVMPLAAAATAESASEVAESSTPVLMLVVLGIISFSAHVIVLFGGRLGQASKTYFAFALTRGFHDVRSNTTARTASRSLTSLNSMFIAYVHAWKTHNPRFAAQPSGPFDGEVVALLREQFPHLTSGPASEVFSRERTAA